MVSTAGSAGVPGWYPAAAACVSVDRSRARIGHCNHLHNGRVAAGDGFLRRLYGELRTAPALRGRFGLVVTFGEVRRDRGVGPRCDRAATIVVGSGVPAGPGTPLPGTTMRCALHRAAVRLPPLRHAADPPHVIPAVIGPDPVRVWEHGLTTKEDSGAIGRPAVPINGGR